MALNPEDVAMTHEDLESAHDYLNRHVAATLGAGETLTSCYRFIASRDGERAMDETRVSKNHRDLLQYLLG